MARWALRHILSSTVDPSNGCSRGSSTEKFFKNHARSDRIVKQDVFDLDKP